MKNILLIMPYGSVGGMERLAQTFYTFYKNQGYTVKAIKFIQLPNDIITFGADEIAFSQEDFYEMSAAKRAFFYLKAPFRLRKIIKKEQITHSIAFGDMANIFSSLTATKEFKIASIHALKSVEFQNKTTLNTLFKLGFKTSYRLFNKVVCISKAIRTDLINHCGYRFNNLEVIYNPHDSLTIQNLAEQPIQNEEELVILSTNTVLFVGRLSIQKAPWHLLKSFALAHKNDKSLQLVMVGDGDEKVIQYLQELIKKYNLIYNVHFFGRKNNPYPYMKAANVVALSSYYEGTPNVIVEAICVGTPIVSTNCTDGIFELMSNKEENLIGNNIHTEAGIITPNVYKGQLGIPEMDLTFSAEERDLSEALLKVINNNSFEEELENEKERLLLKFTLQKVATSYLTRQ